MENKKNGNKKSESKKSETKKEDRPVIIRREVIIAEDSEDSEKEKK